MIDGNDPPYREVIGEGGEEKVNYQNFLNPRLKKEFDVLQIIGEGSYGFVLKVRNKLDKLDYAVKCIELDQNSYGPDIIKEVEILSRLSHPHIVRYFGSWIDDYNYDEDTEEEQEDEEEESSGGIVFQKDSNPIKSARIDNHLCIQMELCHCTLADAIEDNLYRDLTKGMGIFWEIVQGLNYMHQNYIIHRDLKPDNILLDVNSRVKISDLGLATQIAPGLPYDERMSQLLSPNVGTPNYTAPELDSSDRLEYGPEVDMYSVGVMLFEMMYRPLTIKERGDVLKDLREMEIYLPKDFLNDETKAEEFYLIKPLLSHSPEIRPTCLDLLRFHTSKVIKRPVNLDTLEIHLDIPDSSGRTLFCTHKRSKKNV